MPKGLHSVTNTGPDSGLRYNMTHIPLQAKRALERWAELSHCGTGCRGTPVLGTLTPGLSPCTGLICTLAEQVAGTPGALLGYVLHAVLASAQRAVSHSVQETRGLALERLQLKQARARTQRSGCGDKCPREKSLRWLHAARLHGAFRCSLQLMLFASLIPKPHPPRVRLQGQNNDSSVRSCWFVFC